MRRLLIFDCCGAQLSGSLDEAGSTTGLMIVTGGSQTRVGSHRVFERLSKSLSEQGFPGFRFDRRGVGDSAGEDPGYRGSEEDLRAAAAAFRREASGLSRIIGLGLCDGATALALHAAAAGLEGLVLINPWLIEAEAGTPPPAAIRSHYRRRLTSLAGWKKLLTGQVKVRRLLSGLRRAASRKQSDLASEAAAGLRHAGVPVALILAAKDNTAIAAAREVKRPDFQGLIAWRGEVDTDSHTFAKPGDGDALLSAVLQAIAALDACAA